MNVYPYGYTVDMLLQVCSDRAKGESMATVTATAANFESLITDNDIVLFDFWASWCPPCRAFAPVFESASTENPDLVFAKVNTEEEQELAAGFNIMSIPTLMVLRENVIVYMRPGALPQVALNDLIAQVRSLDMEEIRKKVAEQQNAS